MHSTCDHNTSFPLERLAEDVDERQETQGQQPEPTPSPSSSSQRRLLRRRNSPRPPGKDRLPLGNPSSLEASYSNYPMPSNRFIQRSIQYCTEGSPNSSLQTLSKLLDVKHYSPTATQRPHFTGVGQDIALLKEYIPFLLHDQMTFSAVIAMSSLSANIASNGDRQRSPEMLKMYQQALALLRQRLSDPSRQSSDAVIVTLSNLCGFEAMSGNYTAVDTHTRAIQQVVSMRGGHDCLGFEGFLKTIAIAWQAFYNARHSMNLKDETVVPADGILTYPTHPFDPDLCEIIAKFPPGLTEISLSGLLSTQIISLVARLNLWDRDMKDSLKGKDVQTLQELSANARNVALCGEVLHKASLTLVEQLLVMGLLAYAFSRDTTRAIFWITCSYLQSHCKYLNSLHIEVAERNEVFMTWVATTLVATFAPGAQPWLLALSLLESRPTSRDWRENIEICETYFWNEALSLRLASKIEYLKKGAQQGQG